MIVSLFLSFLLSTNKKKFRRKKTGAGPKVSPFLKLGPGTEKFSSKRNKLQTSDGPRFSIGIRKHSKTFRFQNLFFKRFLGQGERKH